MKETAFNMCGFMQPAYVVHMLEMNDPDAFNDRQFIICPEEVEYKYGELKVPVDETIPKLEKIFRVVRAKHTYAQKYTFGYSAKRVPTMSCVQEKFPLKMMRIVEAY